MVPQRRDSAHVPNYLAERQTQGPGEMRSSSMLHKNHRVSIAAPAWPPSGPSAAPA